MINLCGEKVMEAVTEVAEEHSEDVLLLINHMLPDLGKVLARQSSREEITD